MKKIKKLAYGYIDYEGQTVSGILANIIIVFFSVLAYLAGFFFQNLMITFCTFIIGVLVSFIVIIPPWPIYNMHPVKWHQPSKSKKNANPKYS
ncbi:hypothetical protein PCANB_001631 [Pneumocystis canis]|nr:hypothetical protein PCANB_001631 [Pneumocystis canis]